MSAAETELAVVGGGPAGLMLAALAADAGLRVLLLDQAADPAVAESDGRAPERVIALAPSSRQLFERLGLWQGALAAAAGAYRAMRVWQSGVDAQIAFDAGELGLPELGHFVTVRALCQGLDQALGPRVSRCSSARLAALLPQGDGVELRLADGRTVSAAVVVGADGVQSAVRTRAGIPYARRDYRQRGVVATLRPTLAHGGIARQAFTEHGPLGLLPLADGTVSIVWSVAEAEADRLLALPPEAFAHCVAQAAEELGALELLSERAAFPLTLLHAARYASGRVALIGDAAHVVHPLAGLGLNLGFSDADRLAGLLAARGPSVATLARYARQRHAEVRPAVAFIDGLEWLFARPPARLSAAGLRLADRLTPLKREFMRRAASGGG